MSEQELVFETSGGTRTFANSDVLEEWAQHEQEVFSWLAAVQNNVEPVRATKLQYSNFHSQLVSRTTQYKTQETAGGNTDAALANIRAILPQAPATFYLITSDSPEFKFIEAVRERENDEFAAYVLAMFTNDNAATTTAIATRAAYELQQFRNGTNETVGTVRKALDEIYKDFNTKSSATLGELDSQKISHEKRVEKLDSELDTFKNGKQEELDLFVGQNENKLSEIKEKYETELALQAPASYWTDKGKEHFWATIRYWFLTACAAGAFYWAIKDLIETFKPSLENIGGSLVIATATTIGIWTLRILSKLAIANYHLQNDAKERAVMVETYLSLLGSEGGLEKEDIRLVLDSVFRPSTTGLVKEDGVHSPLEVILKKIGQ